MNILTLISKQEPKGDQPNAIKNLVNGIKSNAKFQTLKGATGTGKTFTIANVIAKTQKSTLVIAHNKTLASQLFVELKTLFPQNRVEYYISYFDYYRPEAYKPAQDMYIEKQSIHNWEIEMMRLSTLDALINEKKVIVVASVAAIYGTMNPISYRNAGQKISITLSLTRKNFLLALVRLGYKRVQVDLTPGKFIVNGDTILLVPAWTNDYMIKVNYFGDTIEEISKVDILSKNLISKLQDFFITPATQTVVSSEIMTQALTRIENDLSERLKEFKKQNKLIEYQRLEQRVKLDLEQLKEFGTCSGIENYSFYFEPERKIGDKPYTLFDFLGKDSLLVIDESHMTLPQIGAMYLGDRSRKQVLVDYGFRLPTALDNRPLKYEEFEKMINQVIYISATPAEEELKKSTNNIIEQIIRPTGLLDPTIEIKSSLNQIDDVIEQILRVKKKGERAIINTVTIDLSEKISSFLSEKGLKVAYIHAELTIMQRNEVLRKLRLGIYDAITGIMLLKEGIDLPEVSLILILDSDKLGFSRSATSLIQMIGRVARNVNGHAILYCDNVTKAMKVAIEETNRRRMIQQKYNEENNIIPQTIKKPIPPALTNELEKFTSIKLSKKVIEKEIFELQEKMNVYAKNHNFEMAIQCRDAIMELRQKLNK